MAAVTARNKGRDLDLALAMTEDGRNCCIDPAFEAHAGPLVRWAEAIWHGWQDGKALNLSINRARTRATRARRPWSIVCGPAAACVATAARIGWEFKSAAELRTDDGRMLDLRADPPVVIKREVREAVRRWRWRRVVTKFPSLEGGSVDGEQALGPIRRLLSPMARKSYWGPPQQAALRSAVTGGQWPQARLAAAGVVEDAACLYCKSFFVSAYLHDTIGTFQNRHLRCPVAAAVAKGALGRQWAGFRNLRARGRRQ